MYDKRVFAISTFNRGRLTTHICFYSPGDYRDRGTRFTIEAGLYGHHGRTSTSCLLVSRRRLAVGRSLTDGRGNGNCWRTSTATPPTPGNLPILSTCAVVSGPRAVRRDTENHALVRPYTVDGGCASAPATEVFVLVGKKPIAIEVLEGSR